MRGVFDIDGPVMSIVIKIFDCICLSVLWLACSLPVVTIGASSTAMYATVHRYLRRGEGHLLSTFLRAFRDNFKRSTLVWLAALAVLGVLAADALVLRTMALSGHPLGRLYWPVLLLCGGAITWTAYLFAYAARFNGGVKDVLWFGFALMAFHPLRALGVFLTILAGAVLTIPAPGMAAIIPTAVCWINSMALEKVFWLHMRPEDIENDQREEPHCEE